KSYSEWSIPYKQVFYANTVLDLLPDLRNTASSDTEWNQVKGRALFHRAFSHYQLAQLFCQPYSQGGENNPGIPVRTSAHLGIPVRRATVKETYDQIIADLEEAKTLLPVKAVHALYPSLPAALAMLSKVHLAMQHYEQAEKYAGQVLQLQSTLINYNTLDPTSVRPFPRFNAEVLFHEESYVYQFTYSPLAYMDTLLYDSYAPNDLRKTVFFRNRVPGRHTFKGQYSGIASLFTGLAIDEVYLTRAECRARSGNVAGALEDLNTLLVTRFKTNTFVPIAVTNSDALLEIILQERRKQLVFRPERWTDSRRLNQDARFERTMARKLQGQLYHLAPNSQRYVFEIPVDEITYSNIEQNPR
ncbi:MAG: RagB/SusD family nutrient uptake outer membrane protein, partial [Cytophaga sp.]|nr:RagB/SusD family nutrient uptake outer membrane protein [Cytophaga sp.]